MKINLYLGLRVGVRVMLFIYLDLIVYIQAYSDILILD